MKSSFKIGAAVAACWFALAQGAAETAAGRAAQEADPVLGELDGYQLKQSELERILQIVPEAMRQEVNTPEGRANFVANYLQQKAMVLEALARGLDKEPTVQLEIQINREQVLAEAFRSRKLQEIEVSDQEIEAYYEQNLELFKHPVMVLLNRIIVGNQKEAQEVLSQASQGADFAELANTYSKDIRKDRKGRVGWVRPGQMEPAVEQVIFDLQPGQIGPPVRTAQGWQILQVVERSEAGSFPLKAVHEPIKKQLLEEKRKEAVQSIARQAFEKHGGKIHLDGKTP